MSTKLTERSVSSPQKTLSETIGLINANFMFSQFLGLGLIRVK